jgi:hypothetical protein
MARSLNEARPAGAAPRFVRTRGDPARLPPPVGRGYRDPSTDMITHALVVGFALYGSPATAPATATPATTAPVGAEPRSAAARRRDRKPPWSWRFVGAHYGTGVMTSLLVLPGSYALAGWVGHRGKGLGPVVGAMLIGAFLPSPLVYTAQWAVGRRLFGRRERVWPGLLVHQAGHLAVFTGAVLGGASFHDIRDAAPVVLADALVVTGLASLTAEATRRPLSAEAPELSWERHERLWRPPGWSVIVPLVNVRLP